jgi:hypothetical protein
MPRPPDFQEAESGILVKCRKIWGMGYYYRYIFVDSGYEVLNSEIKALFSHIVRMH